MASTSYTIAFENCSAADATRSADNLRKFLLNKEPGLEVEVVKDRADTQDAGSTLAVILGSTLAASLGKGIADWLRRNSGSSLTVRTPDGELIVRNLSSEDAAKVMDAFRRSPEVSTGKQPK